jgi:hypothetical protein
MFAVLNLKHKFFCLITVKLGPCPQNKNKIKASSDESDEEGRGGSRRISRMIQVEA